MSKEQDSGLSNWTRTPLSEIVLKRPIGFSDEDMAGLRQHFKKIDRALIAADRYQDLDGVFTDLLAHHEVIIVYYDPRYNWGDKEHATKIEANPKGDGPALGINKGAGFLTFTDCLIFSAQCFLSKGEGYGLSKDRDVVETNIDTWLRREHHRVRLSKDEKGIVLEAQRGYDHIPVLRVIGGNFMANLQEFNSHILDESVLQIAEDGEFMFKGKGNTSSAPVVIRL